MGEPATYLRYLAALGCDVDAWETTYLHVLDPDGEDENPVLTWVAATGLRPVIDILTDEDELAAFIEPYAAALADAYPRSSAGVLFPFRRVFAVAHARRHPARPDPSQLSRPMPEPSPRRQRSGAQVKVPDRAGRSTAQALSVVRVGLDSRPVRPFQARLTTCAATSCFLNLREFSHH